MAKLNFPFVVCQFLQLLYHGRFLIDPYLSGCKARDPVPEILAGHSFLTNSLLLPTKTNEYNDHEKLTLGQHRVKQVYLPILKELILVSVLMSDQSVFLLPPRPLQSYPPTLNLLVPVYTPGWREALRGWSVLAKNTRQWPHVADDSKELSSKGFITINIFSRTSSDLFLVVSTGQRNYLNRNIFLLDGWPRQLVNLHSEIQSLICST